MNETDNSEYVRCVLFDDLKLLLTKNTLKFHFKFIDFFWLL